MEQGYAQTAPRFAGVTSKRTDSGTANHLTSAAQICWRFHARAASLLRTPSFSGTSAGVEQLGAGSGLSLQASV